jgi:hypothetical protein
VKKRRKTSKCLNCDQTLQDKHNYCPNCGQENTNNEVSIGLLMREFTSNFFSFDSRFAHTIKPFLFNPGKITEAFLAGKRVFYANPIRWYLVISIFHFFFMTKMVEPTMEDRTKRSFMFDSDTLSLAEFDSLYSLPDTVYYEGLIINDHQISMINTLNSTTKLNASQIVDSLKFDKYSFPRRYVLHQIVRINRETTATVNSYILKQIPIIIFFILPIYAFLLKLFFWRKGLYIKHLIHSIHIHSFFFFLLSCVYIISFLIQDFEDYGIAIGMLLTTIYILFSFRKVYKIKIGWALFRLLFIGFFYMITLSISMGIGIMISLAFY